MQQDLIRVRYLRRSASGLEVWSSVSLDGKLYAAFLEVIGGDEREAKREIRRIAESIDDTRGAVAAGVSRLVQRAILGRVLAHWTQKANTP